LVCVKAGHRTRLLYRVKVHRPRRGERRSFAETDYALLDAAHQYLKAPIVLIWDNLDTTSVLPPGSRVRDVQSRCHGVIIQRL
jgi:hypothetical protein